MKSILIILFTTITFFSCQSGTEEIKNDSSKLLEDVIFKTQDATFVLDTIVSGLKVPYALDWLPDGTAIFTERGKEDSSMRLLDIKTGRITYLCNVPKVFSMSNNGMMDIVVHPDYENNGWIYFNYCIMKPDSTSSLIVERAKINNNCLLSRQQLFEVFPYFKSDNHFGTRMKIKDGYLFISMGERYYARDSAQTLTNDFGKIIRLHEDGRIPADNPFITQKGARSEIWSYGHRNPQGMAFNPFTNELWEHEHGPRGGDEINIIKPGLNYGWPVICYGIDYDSTLIGQGISHKEGMEQPLYYYRPSIAPSGMEFYTGNAFPKWKGNLFIGALALKHLNRLTIEGNRVLHEERLFEKQKWRVRFVKQGPDGFLYIGVDNEGMILRIKPM